MKDFLAVKKARCFFCTGHFFSLLPLLSILLFFCNTEVVFAHKTLTWEPPAKTKNVDGYRVYYGKSSRKYYASKNAFNRTSILLDFLPVDNTYYLAVVSYDTKGKESVYSNEVIYSNHSSGNLPPLAVEDFIRTAEGTPVDINMIANDRDPDGTIDPATVTIASYPANGTLVLNGDGSGTYIPDVGYTGQDVFTYTVQDNLGAISNESKVTVTINPERTIFFDDFSTDTTGDYKVTDTWTEGGKGKFRYDSAEDRVKVVTGDNIGLQFSHDLLPLTTGVFSIDFLPNKKFPSGGKFVLYLRQDAKNYYVLRNTDGYGPKFFKKVVGGITVGRANFSSEYSQNKRYHITIKFSRGLTTVNAFGETLTIKNDKRIVVDRFGLNTVQQSAFYDNIAYKEGK